MHNAFPSDKKKKKAIVNADPVRSSKKLAKVAAARVALAELGEARAGPQRPLPAAPLNQLLADHVARLVNDKFQEMVRNNLIHSKRKVLAGIVLTIDNGVEGAKAFHQPQITAGTTPTKSGPAYNAHAPSQANSKPTPNPGMKHIEQLTTA
ncbi:hypothetical protein RR46_05401 [Papilio xuthus]|uniref:Uncharacterized protein n=1 Tax=Papilio xuthus TaxID=66420 RepID=A0A194Q0V6_PAPXU|nr:hypothetical protein RR46_05401 [Papilio xuthus]